jgi:hypothetical protein
MKSFGAIALGMLLSMVIGILLISGIFGPVFSTLFGADIGVFSTEAGRQLAFPAGLFIFGFAFYFGGMLASYRAPSHRILHGMMVSVVSFAVSMAINVGSVTLMVPEEDPLAGFRSSGMLLFTTGLVAVSVAASYFGARRGRNLYHYNRQFVRRSGKRREPVR